VPSAFGERLLSETGNVEWGEPLDDLLMAQFQARLAERSIGLSPALGQLPSSPPWVTAPQLGALSAAAGFGDTGAAMPNYGVTLPAAF
jgi:hypothetical protein